MKFTIILTGHPALLRNFQLLETTLQKQGNQTAWNQAQHLYSRTRAVVPYLNGDLYDSAYISKLDADKRKPTWVVGYDTQMIEYAVTVHETPNRVHPTRGPSREPKQDHFLSEPRDAMVQSFPKKAAQEMRDAVNSTRFVRSPQRRRR